MTIHVLLFARVRDLAGVDRAEFELPAGATVADLRRAVGDRFPPVANLLDKCAVAINNEFADDSTQLGAGSEAALLPPVSGG